MKWSFLAGLLASAAVLVPAAVSAKAPSLRIGVSRSLGNFSSAGLIARSLLKSTYLSSPLKLDEADSQQKAGSQEKTQLGGVGEAVTLKRGRGENGKAKAKPDILLSRGLGSGGGGEGAGIPSSSVSAHSKNDTLPTRVGTVIPSPSASRHEFVEGGASRGAPSRTEGPSFTQPIPLQTIVGENSGNQGVSSQPSVRHGGYKAPSDVSALSFGGGEGSSSPSRESSGVPSSGGSGGAPMAEESGVSLSPAQVGEYQSLKAERTKIGSLPVTVSSAGGSAKAGSSPVKTAVAEIPEPQQSKTTYLPVVVGSHAKGLSSPAKESSEGELRTAAVSGATSSSSASPSPSNPPSPPPAAASAPRSALAQRAVGVISLLSPNDKTVLEQARLRLVRGSRTKIPEVAEVEEAASVLGFDLNKVYSKVDDAIKELSQKFNKANFANEKQVNGIDLDRNPEKMGEVQRLMQESEALARHQAALKEFLGLRYARVQKALRVVTGDGADAMFRAIRGEVATEPTADELEVKLRQLDEDMRNLDAEQTRYLQAGQTGKAKEAKEKSEKARDEKIKVRENLAKQRKKEREERAGGGTSQAAGSTAADPMAEARKREAEARKEQVKAQAVQVLAEAEAHDPKLIPFLRLLEPQEQVALKTAAINVTYKMDLTYPVTNPKDPNKKVLPVSVVKMISRLTDEQRESLLRGIESRTEEDSQVQSRTRLAALRYAENFANLNGFKFPKWTEELKPPRVERAPARAVAATEPGRAEPIPSRSRVRPTVPAHAASTPASARRDAPTSPPPPPPSSSPASDAPEAPLLAPPAPPAPPVDDTEAGPSPLPSSSAFGRSRAATSKVLMNIHRKGAVPSIVRRSRGLSSSPDDDDTDGHR